ERKAPNCVLHGKVYACECRCGPWTVPPCRHSGDRMEPTRARPVPFCFHSFLPAPETSFLFLVACVPARCAERKCLTASQRRSSLIPPKTSSASSSVPVFLPSRFTTSILAIVFQLLAISFWLLALSRCSTRIFTC